MPCLTGHIQTGAGMKSDVVVPDMGEGVTEGTVVEWQCAVGDSVSKGNILLEMMTDKAVFEVESPATGTVIELLAKTDDELRIGSVIARIEHD